MITWWGKANVFMYLKDDVSAERKTGLSSRG